MTSPLSLPSQLLAQFAGLSISMFPPCWPVNRSARFLSSILFVALDPNFVSSLTSSQALGTWGTFVFYFCELNEVISKQINIAKRHN